MTAELFWTFFCGFIRTGALFLTSPIFSGHVPVQVRVWLSAAVAMAIVPLIGPYIGPPPQDLIPLALGVMREAAMGFLIGFCIQALFQSIQMAGSVLDIQLGLSGSQIFDPVSGAPVSVIQQFKFWSALVIFFCINGHHLVFPALVASYRVSIPSWDSLGSIQTGLIGFIGKLGLLAIQIAAPVAAVAFIIDSASALVNKSVPQFQVFAVLTPAKIIFGLVAMMAALPILTSGVMAGVQLTFHSLEQIFGR